MRKRLVAACVILACAAVPIGIASAGTSIPRAVRRPARPMVALTFDDGPSAYTTAVVEVLRRKGVVATFFMIGDHVTARPAAARAVVAAGDAVANHSMHHEHYIDWPSADLGADLTSASAVIRKTTGRTPVWYKPPYMEMNPAYSSLLPKLGLGLCWPDCAPDDWNGWTAQRIADDVCADIGPGTVIGLHDGSPDDKGDRSATVQAVGTIIDRLRARGYRFVKLGQLPTAAPGL